MSNNEILDGQGPIESTTKNGKSRKLRAGFATLAVLGMGAGLTTAAFTGNVPFAGNVGVNEFGLVGTYMTHSGDPSGTATWAGSVTLSDVQITQASDGGDWVHYRYLWIKDASGADITRVDGDTLKLNGSPVASGSRVTLQNGAIVQVEEIKAVSIPDGAGQQGLRAKVHFWAPAPVAPGETTHDGVTFEFSGTGTGS